MRGIYAAFGAAGPEHASPRKRSIFPMPLLDLTSIGVSGYDSHTKSIILDATNCALRGLNEMHGETCGEARRPTQAQRQVQSDTLDKVARLYDALAESGCQEAGSRALKDILKEDDVSTQAERTALNPDRIACLEQSGLVDPSCLVGDALAEQLTAASLFPAPPPGLNTFKGLDRRDKQAYGRLVARDLRSGKLRLHDSVKAGGTVFTVPKTDGSLREVWHGTRPSQAARVPPKPVHLANPEALARISLLRGERLWASKRDCRALFDQLRAPVDLRPYFGRPSLTVQELQDAGMSMEEIHSSWSGEGPFVAKSVVWPVSCVWPMGFSWSSCVAQSTMLATMQRSGRSEKEMVSLQQPIPSSNRDLSALATDDVIHLTTLGPSRSISFSTIRTTISNCLRTSWQPSTGSGRGSVC